MRICADEAAHTHDNDRTETGHRNNRKRKCQLSFEKKSLMLQIESIFTAVDLSKYVGKKKGHGKSSKGKATQSEVPGSHTTSTS